MKSFQEYLNTVNKFADWYEEITDNDNSLMAISVLSQNRIELEREFENFTKMTEVSERLSTIKEFVSIEDEKNDEIKKASQTVMDSLNTAFPYSLGFSPFFDVDKQTLKQQLKEFWKLTGGKPFEWNGVIIDDLIEDDRTEDFYLKFVLDVVDNAYDEKIIGEGFIFKNMALEYIIKKVFEKNYPEDISKYLSQEEAKDEIKENYQSVEEARGRPLKQSAPQEEIKNQVLMLAKKAKNEKPGYKKYWHFNDRYGTGPNKNQMKENIIEEEIASSVDDKTIIRRIEAAFEDADL